MAQEEVLLCRTCGKLLSITSSTVVCPQCKSIMNFISVKNRCFVCNETYNLWIPDDSQILETHIIDTHLWPKDLDGEEVPSLVDWEIQYRCPTPDCKVFHPIIIPGYRSAGLLRQSTETRGFSVPYSLLSSWGMYVGEKFQTIGSNNGNSIMTSLNKHRLGEIFAFALLAFICYLAMIPFAFDGTIPIYVPFVYIAILFSLLYFCYITWKDVVVVVGEMELKSGPQFRYAMYDAFKVAFNPLLLGLFSFALILWHFFDDIGSYDSYSDFRLFQDFFMAPILSFVLIMVGQCVSGFAAFLYPLQSNVIRNQKRMFKTPLLEMESVIEKLGEISIHIVLFLSSIVIITSAARYAIAEVAPQTTMTSAMYFDMSDTIFQYIIILVPTLPLFLFFLFLGKFVSNYKASEIQKINNEINIIMKSEVINKQQLIKDLTDCRDEVKKCCGWVHWAEYGSRIGLVVAFLINASSVIPW